MFIAGAGGFVGTCCRFLVNRLFLVTWKASFPLATFTINILGCFIFGLLTGLLSKSGVISPRWNALFITGFCGGFTTFSTFSYESFNLGMNGEMVQSLIYIFSSIVVGLLAVWVGVLLTR